MPGTTTTRVALYKPDATGIDNVNVVTDLNNNLDKIDSWLGATICTSGTRPVAPWAGQIIRESDTSKMYCWSGSAWGQILHGTANYDSAITVSSGDIKANVGAFLAKRATNGTSFDAALSADTVSRWSMDSNGKQEWGAGGATTRDTNLYRSAADTLKTDDGFQVGGALAVTGATSLGGTLAVTGDTTLSGNLSVAGVGKDIFAYATADEPRTSTTTTTASSYLTASVVASGVYKMELYVPFSSAAANSLKFGWIFPSGLTMNFGGVYFVGSFVARNFVQTDTVNPSAEAGVNEAAIYHGTVFVSSTAGTLAFSWAQGTSSATSVILKKGAYLHLQRMV